MEQAGGVDNLRKQADMAQTSRPCDGCGNDVPRTKPTGPIPPFCGDGCKPRCSVEECNEAVRCRGWCAFHYTRWKLTGAADTPLSRGKNNGACSVDGCREPMRKRGWCASHYGQWRASGEGPKPFVWRWAHMEMCRVCGSPPAYGFRHFCSGACAFLWRKYEGRVPQSRECVGCGKRIDLTKRGKGGQRIRADVKLCRRCRIDKRKHGMSVEQLANRDGLDCGICRKSVDMTLRKGDPDGKWRPSVDHIIPRARGGTNDPENLQLAHLCCNQSKRDRLDFVA